MVKGIILDHNDTLAILETSSTGLGEFTLPPTTNSNLSAKIYWTGGNETIELLPQMQPAGVTLQASVTVEKLFYKIESYPAFFSPDSEIFLAIIMHNDIVFAKWFQNTADLISYTSYIPLNQFLDGVMSLRLYTSEGKIISEREVYHYKEKNVVLEKKEISFEPKGRNEIEITLPDTLNSTYSISITDADLSDELIAEDKRMMKNYEEPFSFSKKFTNNEKGMNLYLLARNDLSHDSILPFRFAYQQGLNVSGRLYYPKTSRPVSNKTINFFPKNSSIGSFLLSDSLDENGNFELKNLFVDDSTVLCWNINGLNTNELNKIKLRLNSNWFDSMKVRPTVLQKKNAKDENYKNDKSIVNALKKYYTIDSLEKKKTKTLPEVTIFALQRKRIEELDKTYAGTSLFGGRLAEVFAYDMEEEKSYYPNVVSFLQGRIPDLKVMGPPYNPLLMYRSTGHPMSGAPITNVAVFINENRVEAVDIATISISDIAYVKVFKPPYTYILVTPNKPGEKPPALAIAVFLKRGVGKISTGSTFSSFQNFAVPGFSLPATFPEPDYSAKNETENIPDKRITLYWNPEMSFEKGKAKIVFYNNDFSKKYLLKLEGINEFGEVVTFRQVIDK